MNNIIKWEDQSHISEIKKLFAPTLTQQEFTTFVAIGKTTGLSPFLREIWAVKYKDSPANIFIGRDGYRKSAQTNNKYDYHTVDAVYDNDEFHYEFSTGNLIHKYNLKDRGNLVGAYCLVKRKGSTRASYTFCNLSEYNTGRSVWRDKPATMIKKVAEAQGLRGSFQELFAGTYYDGESTDDMLEGKNENSMPSVYDLPIITKHQFKQIAQQMNEAGLETAKLFLTESIMPEYSIPEYINKKIKELADCYEDNQKVSDDDIDNIWKQFTK